MRPIMNGNGSDPNIPNSARGPRAIVARLWAGRKSAVGANLSARVAALGALVVASVLLGRTEGPALVGAWVLLRVLPWLTGVLFNCGLAGAAPYFLAGEPRAEARYRPTIFLMALVTGTAGGVAWALASPLLAHTLFPHLDIALVAWAGITVATQAMETTAKAASQGFDDLKGSNLIIALEEITFLPFYVALILVGLDPHVAIVAALPLGDLATSVPGWLRLAHRGFFRDTGPPSIDLARRLASYGARAQLGSVILLLNARLDFALVGALVGPASLGIYAVASRFAELLRVPALAFNYVLYPAYARDEGPIAARKARDLLPKVAWIPIVAAVPLAVAVTFALPLVYGPAFRPAIGPSYVLLAGMAGVMVSGIITAFLYGEGRPGLNSLAMGAGLVVTVVLDLLLIPRFGVMGAAAASCAAYLTTTAALVLCFTSVTRSYERSPLPNDAVDPRAVKVR